MWWKRKSSSEQNVSGEGLSSGIKQYVLKKEGKLAGYLNHKVNKLSVKGQILLLFMFCTLFGGVSLYLVLNTFLGQSTSSDSIKPDSINVPRHLNKTGEENVYPNLLVTEEDIRQVKSFRLFMDSLYSIPNGKPIYDSIISSRPGLMDTINMLEQLYLLQQNK